MPGAAAVSPGVGGRPQEPFGNPLSWSAKTFADRRDDIRAIQQALATSPEFAGRVDLARLGTSDIR